jgi:hypothetical protein
VLGFTKEITGALIRDEDTAKVPTIVLAVLALYMADFSVNASKLNILKARCNDVGKLINYALSDVLLAKSDSRYSYCREAACSHGVGYVLQHH